MLAQRAFTTTFATGPRPSPGKEVGSRWIGRWQHRNKALAVMEIRRPGRVRERPVGFGAVGFFDDGGEAHLHLATGNIGKILVDLDEIVRLVVTTIDVRLDRQP